MAWKHCMVFNSMRPVGHTRARRNTPRVNYSQLHRVGELFPSTMFPNSADNDASTSRPDPSAVNANGHDAQGTASSEAPVGGGPGSTPSGAQSAPPSLAAWATENGLTGATIKTLEDNGCDTVDIVTSLLECDVQEMGLNIGQRRMLLKAIQAAARSNQPSAPPGVGLPQTLQPAVPSLGSHGLPDPLQALVTPGPNDSGGAGLPLADLLSQGQGRQDGGIDINKRSQSSVGVRDPEVFLHLAAQKGEAQYHDIVDFVLGDIAKKAESVLGANSDFELVARSLNSKQNKLWAVTPQQWSAANSAIMARLLQDGLLGLEGVNQYLNYTYKVGELGHVYTWQSVLTYDRQYRILQSRLLFAWGTDISHLRATTLVPKPVNTTASYVNWKAARNNSQQRKFGGSEKAAGQSRDNFNSQYNLCRDFNRGSCSRPNCKFAHRCGIPDCFEKQPASQHDAHSKK